MKNKDLSKIRQKSERKRTIENAKQALTVFLAENSGNP